MGCCGVPRSSDPETYLRLAFERTLLSRGPGHPMLEGFEGAVISRALTAAGTLDQETAQRVLDEYDLARALRQPQRGRMLMHRRSMAQGQRQRFSAERVASAIGTSSTARSSGRSNGCSLVTTPPTSTSRAPDPPGAEGKSKTPHGDGARPAREGMAQHPHPQTLALADDQGTTATAHVGSVLLGRRVLGGDVHERRATFGPDTQWIELDGSRLELPERQPAPEVHVEDDRADRSSPRRPLRARS